MSLGSLLLSVIVLLIVLAILVLIFRVLMWGIAYLGIPVPPDFVKIVYFIAALIVLYLIVQWLLGISGGFHLPSVN